MKKMITFALLLSMGLTASAQDDLYGGSPKKAEVTEPDTTLTLNESGVYERQLVVNVEGANAAVLYDRAMTALSDWTGPDGKARAGIDYQNQETHTVIYKGTFSLGFKNTFLGDGWHRMANFTMKVRCKDGRAQVTLTVPFITGTYSRGNIERTWSMAALKEAVGKSKGDKRKRGEALLHDIVSTTAIMVGDMMMKLKQTDNDDDF